MFFNHRGKQSTLTGYNNRKPISRPNIDHIYNQNSTNSDEKTDRKCQLALKNHKTIQNIKTNLDELSKQLKSFQKDIRTQISNIELKPGPMGLDGLTGPTNSQQVITLGRLKANKSLWMVIPANRFVQQLNLVTATTDPVKLIINSNKSNQNLEIKSTKAEQAHVIELNYDSVSEATSYSFKLETSTKQSLLQLLVITDYDGAKEVTEAHDELVTIVYRFDES